MAKEAFVTHKSPVYINSHSVPPPSTASPLSLKQSQIQHGSSLSHMPLNICSFAQALSSLISILKEVEYMQNDATQNCFIPHLKHNS